tara:strand:+ start:158 stop:988 length:831 start_codon:yes stop_codon:yes gene_type:complete
MLKCGITGYRGILGSELINNKKFNYIKFRGDITKKKIVEKWVKNNNFDLIIHLAALVPTYKVNKYYNYSMKVNYFGTKYLVDSLIKFKKEPKLFFYASTSHVYKLKQKNIKISENGKLEPSSKYGRTKLLSEIYIRNLFQKYKIKYCVGRIFSFTHIKQDKSFLIPSLFKKIKKNKYKNIKLKDLNHYRDFLSLKDIVKAIEILCTNQKKGIYNIGSGKKISLIKIASFFSKKFNKKISFTKSSRQPSFLISNNSKLLKTGWRPKIKINSELEKFL